MKKWFGVLVALMFLSAMVYASPPPGSVNIALAFNQLCKDVKGAVPIIAFTMLILGGLIYAAGQVMGAETRARANVWATAMVTGGIIGLLIAASAKYVIILVLGMFTGTYNISAIAGASAC